MSLISSMSVLPLVDAGHPGFSLVGRQPRPVRCAIHARRLVEFAGSWRFKSCRGDDVPLTGQDKLTITVERGKDSETLRRWNARPRYSERHFESAEFFIGSLFLRLPCCSDSVGRGPVISDPQPRASPRQVQLSLERRFWLWLDDSVIRRSEAS